VRSEAEGKFLACRDRAMPRSDHEKPIPAKFSNLLFENQKMWYLKPHRRSERAYGRPRGQHRSLKRFISAKEIQAVFFDCPGFGGLGGFA
jgi:hypothetical protein